LKPTTVSLLKVHCCFRPGGGLSYNHDLRLFCMMQH